LIGAGLLGLASPALALNPNGVATYYYTTEVGDPTGTDPDLQTTHRYPVGGARTQSDQTTLGSTAISTSIDTTGGLTGFRIGATATAVPDTGAAPDIADRSFAEAETSIIFYITAMGAAGSYVPVNVKALLQSSGSEDPSYGFGIFGIATGYTSLEIKDNVTDSPPNDYFYANCPFQNCPEATTLNLNKTVELIANRTYEVQESVFVQAGALTTDGAMTATATADPQFEVPYSYHLANPGVSLTISPGMESLITVPEPGAWALMLAGFGLCGAMVRRRARSGPGGASTRSVIPTIGDSTAAA
jgi:hypothetical protein